MKIIKAKKITKKNFSKFGQLIDTSKKNPININDGYAKRFDNLINLDASKNKGKAIVSIFKAKKRRFPMKIDMMEKHPLGSQAFIPMEDTKFLVFVAPKGDKPDINKIQSFLVPKQTGVNYNAGIWHFPLISIKDMNFLIVDRKGKGNYLVIYKFKKDKIIYPERRDEIGILSNDIKSMSDDLKIRNNRLNLLSLIRNYSLKIADFTLLNS